MKRIGALVLLFAACGDAPAPAPPPSPEQAAVLARIEAIRPKVEAVLGAPLGDLPEIVVERRERVLELDEDASFARDLSRALVWLGGFGATFRDRTMERLTVYREALARDDARLEAVLAGLLARRWIARRVGLEGASFESRPEDPFPRVRDTFEEALHEEVARRLTEAFGFETNTLVSLHNPVRARTIDAFRAGAQEYGSSWGEFARAVVDAWGVPAACDAVRGRRTPTPREILHPGEYLKAEAGADPLYAAVLAVRAVFPGAPAANLVVPDSARLWAGGEGETPEGFLDGACVRPVEMDPFFFEGFLLYRFADAASAAAYVEERLRAEEAFAAEVRAAPGGVPLPEFGVERVEGGGVVRWRCAAENADEYAILRAGVLVVDTGCQGPFSGTVPPMDLARRAVAALEGRPLPELEDWQRRWIGIRTGTDVEAGLADPDRRVQGRALHEIWTSDREAELPFEKLAPFLVSPDRELRAVAHEVLATRVSENLGDDEREALARALADPDAEVRKITLEALYVDLDADPRFLAAAKTALSDPLTLVRRAAYQALSWMVKCRDLQLEGEALEAYERAKAEFE